MPQNDMTKFAAAAPGSDPNNMQREAKITWSLSILPPDWSGSTCSTTSSEHLARQLALQLLMPVVAAATLARVLEGADAVGLCFWIICNTAQFRVFNRTELSTLNWLLNWHTLLLSLLAVLQLVTAARAQNWYRRHRLSAMLAMRLSRTATQLVAYWHLGPRDILQLSGCKGTSKDLGAQATKLLLLVPLTQMQQALSCLLPFSVMLPVQLVSAALYVKIYLPKQLCTIRLVPALPELVHSWSDSLSAGMNRCMLLLALIPGAAGAPSGCSSSRDEAMLRILMYFMLLLLLFIPVAFVFKRELAHKLHFLREQGCRVVCAWDSWAWIQGAPPRLLVAAVVLLVPWQCAVAGAAMAMRLLPFGTCP
ncbi:hypothetical protein COO60DRAFT_1686394 [Scenedesmus sp. NREL 46B-D3]|nr:hypothetical protein COO60DRAFT_1686394 [Scenedesmus sp. NREL 46B-D3]